MGVTAGWAPCMMLTRLRRLPIPDAQAEVLETELVRLLGDLLCDLRRGLLEPILGLLQRGCRGGIDLVATAARAAQSGAVAEQPPLAPTPTAAADDDGDAPPADAPLPLGGDEFPDEALAVVCSFLGLRELGRLACAARRFTEPTLTEPGGGGAGGAQLLSPIEEGARLRLAAGGSGGAVVRRAEETWVRALWRVQHRLHFTSCGPEVVLSEEGALRLRAYSESGSGCDAWCLGVARACASA